MEKNQPLFVEFYNLHLDCCLTIVPRNEIDRDRFWYQTEISKEEREELEVLALARELFELPQGRARELSTEIPKHEWKRKYWIKRGNQFVLEQQENIDEKDINYPVFPEQKWAGKLAIVAINPPSTETKSKITEFFRGIPDLWVRLFTSVMGSMEDYKYTHGINWYEGKDFLDFMFDYFCFQTLINGYLEGKISTWTLEWLQEKIQNYSYSLMIYKDNEQVRTTTLGDEIVIDSFYFKRSGIRIEGLPYGLGLAFFFANIYLGITQTLEEKKEIRQCVYNDCNNIFYANHQSQKYCFDKVCLAKRSAESSRKSDNRSRNRIRKRIVRSIDEWLEDKELISAAELMKEIPTIAKIMRNQKEPAKSLGIYLSGKLMAELLKEKGIELTVKKERNINLYCFERIAIP